MPVGSCLFEKPHNSWMQPKDWQMLTVGLRCDCLSISTGVKIEKRTYVCIFQCFQLGRSAELCDSEPAGYLVEYQQQL